MKTAPQQKSSRENIYIINDINGVWIDDFGVGLELSILADNYNL